MLPEDRSDAAISPVPNSFLAEELFVDVALQDRCKRHGGSGGVSPDLHELSGLAGKAGVPVSRLRNEAAARPLWSI